MSETFSINFDKNPRVLVLSLRNIEFAVSRSYTLEIEDTITNFDRVETLAPARFSGSQLNKFKNIIARNAFKTTGKGNGLNPIINKFKLEKEYDLFFYVCQYPIDLLYLNTISNWREKCKKAVCWLDEVWVKDVDKLKPQLLHLNKFDYIFTGLKASAEAISKIVNVPCDYMPPGVDAIKFCPYPMQLHRSVDVCNLGRRWQNIHTELLDLVEEKGIFYIHDTLDNKRMQNHREHRSLYRNIIKRSRYFIACKPKVDLAYAQGQEETSVRFFEGAAGGAVMLGIPPNCDTYRQNFDWTDATIALPNNGTGISKVIAELDAQPERLAKIRTDNIVNSLLRHDWVYRWGKILDIAGISHTPEMARRQTDLQNLAQMVQQKSRELEISF